ncbi:hypothetical protein RF11_14956 [Thelohanellus kitauei]|uniref:Uncharacterized protein n=1 Tax=Thelohanellus kitauei TaxID=669202 RepID=A0A0C2MTZ2_THEKT|nr:hypothetical protein RF11_14956 [Thelohanellus kitauei]
MYRRKTKEVSSNDKNDDAGRSEAKLLPTQDDTTGQNPEIDRLGRTTEEAAKSPKVLKYLGARVISTNNRRSIIRGVRTKAEYMNLNKPSENARIIKESREDSKEKDETTLMGQSDTQPFLSNSGAKELASGTAWPIRNSHSLDSDHPRAYKTGPDEQITSNEFSSSLSVHPQYVESPSVTLSNASTAIGGKQTADLMSNESHTFISQLSTTHQQSTDRPNVSDVHLHSSVNVESQTSETSTNVVLPVLSSFTSTPAVPLHSSDVANPSGHYSDMKSNLETTVPPGDSLDRYQKYPSSNLPSNASRRVSMDQENVSLPPIFTCSHDSLITNQPFVTASGYIPSTMQSSAHSSMRVPYSKSLTETQPVCCPSSSCDPNPKLSTVSMQGTDDLDDGANTSIPYVKLPPRKSDMSDFLNKGDDIHLITPIMFNDPPPRCPEPILDPRFQPLRSVDSSENCCNKNSELHLQDDEIATQTQTSGHQEQEFVHLPPQVTRGLVYENYTRFNALYANQKSEDQLVKKSLDQKRKRVLDEGDDSAQNQIKRDPQFSPKYSGEIDGSKTSNLIEKPESRCDNENKRVHTIPNLDHQDLKDSRYSNPEEQTPFSHNKDILSKSKNQSFKSEQKIIFKYNNTHKKTTPDHSTACTDIIQETGAIQGTLEGLMNETDGSIYEIEGEISDSPKFIQGNEMESDDNRMNQKSVNLQSNASDEKSRFKRQSAHNLYHNLDSKETCGLQNQPTYNKTRVASDNREIDNQYELKYPNHSVSFGHKMSHRQTHDYNRKNVSTTNQSQVKNMKDAGDSSPELSSKNAAIFEDLAYKFGRSAIIDESRPGVSANNEPSSYISDAERFRSVPKKNPPIPRASAAAQGNYYPPQNYYSYPDMNYQQYNSSLLFPQQYMNHFVPPLLYSHPHDRFAGPFNQSQLYYTPRYIPYPHDQSPFSYQRPNDPNTAAFIQWQEEYSKWYRNYQNSLSLQTSRRNSFEKSPGFLASQCDNFSNVFSEQRSMDDRRSVGNSSLNFQEPRPSFHRTTPLFYATDHATFSFGLLIS